jgi:hypothetical protein
MRNTVFVIIIVIWSWARPAQAQWQSVNWLHVAYTYTDLTYKQSGMSEKGRVLGVRGEAGLNLFPRFALSVGGEYQDGNLNHDGTTLTGTTLKEITTDYFRDLRAMAHFIYTPLVISVGMGQRYWYDNLIGTYRRRTQYDYIPLIVTTNKGPLYIQGEWDFWRKGYNTSQIADLGGAHHDVDLNQNSGGGMAFEIGYRLFSGKMMTRLFLNYRKWQVHKSDTANDGVENVTEPDNNTVTLQGGIGLDF